MEEEAQDEEGGEKEPTPALPRPEGADEGDAVSLLCRAVCTDDDIKVWWDEWRLSWMDKLRAWEFSDEEARVHAARNARKEAKELGMNKAEMAALVEDRVAALSTALHAPTPPPIPAIADSFSEELAAFRARALNEAMGRIHLMRAKRDSMEARADETAMHRATLADAKARILGKETRYKKSLRLPVKDFRHLKTGVGVRTGVSHLTGGIVENLRLEEGNSSGTFELRDRGVDDEWAAQIGDGLAQGTAPNLTNLDLSNNRISYKGAKWVGNGVVYCTNLVSLALGSNNIDKKGLDVLADAILVQGKLEALRLNSLKFGEKLTDAPSHASLLRPKDPDDEAHRSPRPEASSATLGSLGSDVHAMLQAGAPKGVPVSKASREVATTAATLITGGKERGMGGEKKGAEGGEEWEVGLGRIVPTIMATESLRHLDLGGNRMGPVLIGQLCDALSLNTSVRWVNIGGNRAGADGGAHVGRLLATSDRLQFMDAGSNDFGVEGAEFMASQINTNTSLTELRMSSNGMGADANPYMGQIFGSLLGLRSIDVSGNEIDEDTAAEIRAGIVAAREQGGYTDLTSLKLSQNPFGDKGVKEMVVALQNLNLWKLQLLNCDITDIGAGMCGALAATLPELRVLSLALNRVTDIGVAHMHAWMGQRASRCRIEELNLDGNLCSDLAVEKLAALVKRGPWLKRLSVQGNFVSTPGMKLILGLIVDYPQVTKFGLKGNVDADEKDVLHAETLASIEAVLVGRGGHAPRKDFARGIFWTGDDTKAVAGLRGAGTRQTWSTRATVKGSTRLPSQGGSSFKSFGRSTTHTTDSDHAARRSSSRNPGKP